MNLFGGAPSGDAVSSASECGGIRSSCFHLAEVDGDAAGSQVENADIVHLICLSNFSTCQRHGSGGSLRHLATARPTRCRVQRQAGGRWIYFVTRGSFAGRQIYIQLALFGYFYEAEGGRERGRRKARRWRCGRAAASSYSAVIGRQFFSEQQISAARPPGRPCSMELLFCLRPSKRSRRSGAAPCCCWSSASSSASSSRCRCDRKGRREAASRPDSWTASQLSLEQVLEQQARDGHVVPYWRNVDVDTPPIRRRLIPAAPFALRSSSSSSWSSSWSRNSSQLPCRRVPTSVTVAGGC